MKTTNNPRDGETPMGTDENRSLYEEKSRRLPLPASFRIYADRLEAYFFPYRHTIYYADIERVGTLEKIPWYVGWGLRVDPLGKKLYFAIHHGKQLEIESNSGYWKKTVLSVERPEKFLAAVNEWFADRETIMHETEKHTRPMELK